MEHDSTLKAGSSGAAPRVESRDGENPNPTDYRNLLRIRVEHARQWVQSSQLPTAAMFVALLMLIAVEPASAQESVGSVYCDTVVERGIDMVFGAIAGLGLPVTLFYIIRGGVSYMRAGGRPQRKDDAREQVLMAGVGFGIVLLALAAPELIDKFGSQLGFGFSDCVQPF